MTPWLAGASERQRRHRQEQCPDGDGFGSIEIDVDQATGWRAVQDTDVALDVELRDGLERVALVCPAEPAGIL